MSFECCACKKPISGYRRRDCVCDECREKIPVKKVCGFKILESEEVPEDQAWFVSADGKVDRIINIGTKK